MVGSVDSDSALTLLPFPFSVIVILIISPKERKVAECSPYRWNAKGCSVIV